MVVLCGHLEVVVVEAEDLPNLDHSVLRPEDKSDPYCVVELQSSSGSVSRIGKTFTIDDCLNPRWYCKLASDINQEVAGLRFTVKDRDVLSSETIGSCFLPTHTFISGVPNLATLNVQSQKGIPTGTLKVKVSFFPTKSSEITFGDRAATKATEFRERFSKKKSKSGDSSNSYTAMFLHGYLDILIDKAQGLPNLDSSILSLRARDVSDPFVVISLEDNDGEPWKVATTSVIDNDLNPEWNESFRVDVCHEALTITFTVRDKDFLSSEVIGSVSFPIESLLTESTLSGTFNLFRDGKNKKAGQLTLSVTFHPKEKTSPTHEVPECLYPLRHDSHVTLYQDSHCPELPIPIISQTGFQHFPRSTWRDIYTTLTTAKKFIYIIGWSVSAKVPLLRNAGDDNRTLGEILIAKASQGVQICLLLWDELTSNDIMGKAGKMNTEDEETAAFFKGTGVTVVLAPRSRKTEGGMFSTKQSFTMMCYTHHQKCVIADAEIPEMPGYRKVIAYVGGLDLTGGRYDSPEHPLFRTLIHDHKNDFRNKVYPGLTSDSGPREPWHDIHSKVEGIAALDIVANFEERWRKQAADYMEGLINIKETEGLLWDYRVSHPDRWSVQMFRSINTDSALLDQFGSGHALRQKKGRLFDNSIHRAYIHHIRRARKFIYIENQYFMGSSHMWPQCRDAKAGNLVPLEISAKIEDKIKKGERFVAYIVIPMFPEGKPADKVTQEMLHWQLRTMQMMYQRVAAAIQHAGIDAHPLDYLLFLCLGSKEGPNTKPFGLTQPDDPFAAQAFSIGRGMIYVHSKMAIFDDEYIIVGSANINDRSLSGNRDTEIAIGAFQPINVGINTSLAFGDVSVFRRSLWAEHMGTAAPILEDPASLQCARKVRALADDSLRVFLDNGPEPSPRHLLLYPLLVNTDGTVTARSDCACFPDTNGSVLGARSKVFPSSLTT